MIGILILIILVLWLVITLVAIRVGWQMGNKKSTKLLGAFLGFMLTMGVFVVNEYSWKAECDEIQRTVTHLCETEGGITIHISPEEWRKQIGEAKWKKLVPYPSPRIDYYDYEHKSKIFNGKRYPRVEKYNSRVFLYGEETHVSGYILSGKYIIFDVEKEKVLATKTYFYVTGSEVYTGLYVSKIELRDIQTCSRDVRDDFRILVKKYSNEIIAIKDE